MSDNPKPHWHLDRNVSVGHIASTFMIFVSFVMWAINMDKKVEQNALSIQHLAELRDEDQSRQEASMSELKSNLRDINLKLDRLIEREVGR